MSYKYPYSAQLILDFCDVCVASSGRNTNGGIMGYPKWNVDTIFIITFCTWLCSLLKKVNDLQLVVNQPYDEALEVNDDEEVASTFTPSPRPAGGKSGGYNPGEKNHYI